MPDAQADHESKCKKCGACCRRKIKIEGVVFWTPFICRFLDRVTKLCTVYPDRHARSETCLPIAEALAQGGLPRECAYVDGIEGYKGPIDGFDFWDFPEQVQREWAARIGVSAGEFDQARAEHYTRLGAKPVTPAPVGA